MYLARSLHVSLLLLVLRLFSRPHIAVSFLVELFSRVEVFHVNETNCKSQTLTFFPARYALDWSNNPPWNELSESMAFRIPIPYTGTQQSNE